MSNTAMEYIGTIEQGVLEYHVFQTGNEIKWGSSAFYDKQGNCTFPFILTPTDYYSKPQPKPTEPIDKKENGGC